MARFDLKPKVSFELHMTLSEEEARALEAIAGYNVDELVQHFYTHMGRAYLEPYEGGLRKLMESAKSMIRPQLAKVDKARKAFEE